MRLEVGKRYKLRDGTEVTVLIETEVDSTYVVFGEDDLGYTYTWTKDGIFNINTKGNPWDVVEKLPHPALSFKEGHQYKLRNGNIVTITKIHEDPEYIYVVDGIDEDINTFSWTKEGFIDHIAGEGMQWDIVKEYFVTDEEVPEKPFSIEVGKKYLLKNGDIATINKVNDEGNTQYPVVGTDESGITMIWTLDGKYDIEEKVDQWDIQQEYRENDKKEVEQTLKIEVGTEYFLKNGEVVLIEDINKDKADKYPIKGTDEAGFGMNWTLDGKYDLDGEASEWDIQQEYHEIEPSSYATEIQIGDIWRLIDDTEVRIITYVEEDERFVGLATKDEEEYFGRWTKEGHDNNLNIRTEYSLVELEKRDPEYQFSKLEVGKIYKTKNDRRVLITDVDYDYVCTGDSPFTGKDVYTDEEFIYDRYGKTFDSTMNIVLEEEQSNQDLKETDFLADFIGAVAKPKAELSNITLKIGGVYETGGGFTIVLLDKEGDVWIGLDNEGGTYRYDENGKTLDFTMNLVKELPPLSGYLVDMLKPKVEMPNLSDALEDTIHKLMGIDLHRHLLQDLHDTYVAKNKDYGNSFEKSLDEFGLIASIVRISDKLERLKSLKDKERGEVDESLIDTCLDAANYFVMTAMWLNNKKT